MIRLGVFIAFLLTDCFAAQAQRPELRRVCRSGVNNTLFFNSGSDTCSLFQQYFVHARNGETGAFFILDSIEQKDATQYIHQNANPGAPTLWYYFLEYVDSCGPVFSRFSDTVVVDIIPPDTTYIDSVSINIETNSVHIGWRNNLSPDFLNFLLYRIDAAGIFTEISNGGTRDTNWVDVGVNPRAIAFTYDLLSRDSCSNPQIFGLNPHRPMLLRFSVDTCNKSTRIFWSPYLGWPVSVHHIYLDTGTGYFLKDTVGANVFEYTMPISLGVSHSFFVRAFADTVLPISSSSNNITFSTRLRIDPDSVWLQNVTYQNSGNSPVSVVFGQPRITDVLRVEVHREDNGDIRVFDVNPPYVFPLTWNDVSTELTKYKYVVKLFGLCNVPNSESEALGNFLLSASEDGNDAILNWKSEAVWLEGIEKFEIYRASVDDVNNISYTLLTTLPGNNFGFRDEGAVQLSGKEGMYYIIKAIQKPGSDWGGVEDSYSNNARVTGNITVFIPNAFRPTGFNRTFRPEGMFIDYARSSMQIYDRWGGIIANLKDITTGWDGMHMNGNMCPQGVYIYEITIFDLDGKEQKKRGTVTLLN